MSFFNLAVKNTMKLIGTSKNGIQVFREVLNDGTVVTKSFKNGNLYKEIRQTKGIFLESGYNPRNLTYTKSQTSILNHATGESRLISKSYHPQSGDVNFTSYINGKEGRNLTLKNNTIIEDTVWKYQPEGGYISVTRQPHISSTPSRIIASNYKTPSGETIITGDWYSSKGTLKEHYSKAITQYVNIDGIIHKIRSWGHW